MRKILDKMFENKKLAMLVPLVLATLVYLLFVLFGAAENKMNLVIEIPIICAIGFFGGFFVLLIQVKNPSCPEWFLNSFELLCTISWILYAIIGTIRFVIGGFQDFDLSICLGFVVYSAFAWAHSKRNKT